MTARRRGNLADQNSTDMHATSCRMRVLGGLVLLFIGAPATLAGEQRLSDERLAGLLSAAGDAEARAALLQQLGEAVVACPALAGFGTRADPAIREQAVRSMDQAGCTAIEYYRPFMRDPRAWVTDALVTAIERHRIGEGVPFLIRHLPDPRRILSGRGVWTVGERAHRALRVVSCQSMHYDPGASQQERARAAARWNTWYAEHGGEPRAKWLEAGLERASAYLAGDGEQRRLEGLELLLLIGTPGGPALQAAFRRDSEDLETSLICTPEEPPRVTEEVPCRFEVSNRSDRRVAFIPGEMGVALHRRDPEGGAGTSVSNLQSSSPPESIPAGESMAGWIDRVVDLAPGERLQWPLRIGPVQSAGRYEVRGTLFDLSAHIVNREKAGKGGVSMAIEASTIVRFEQ